MFQRALFRRVDQAAEERDVRSGADRRVDVGHRARAREARIDVDQLRAALTFAFIGQRNATGWFSAMFEPMTMTQSESAIVARIERGRTAAEPRPQTGDAAGCHMRA